TFIMGKVELKRLLSAFKVSDKNANELLAKIDKTYRHINAIAFAESLQRLGLKQEDITNILRRAELDDVTISGIFDMIETERIRSTFGKLVDLSVD
ncbi:hypothetical protein B1B_08081, partial [mine drainage metagenome]